MTRAAACGTGGGAGGGVGGSASEIAAPLSGWFESSRDLLAGVSVCEIDDAGWLHTLFATAAGSAAVGAMPALA